MEKFEHFTAPAVPLVENNLDTDQICPKQHLKTIHREGFDKALFSDRRFDAQGNPIPDFVLNRPEYARAGIMIGGENFACGSSREHAVWALVDYGIRCVIAPSYGEIFLQNTVNSGLLAIVLPLTEVERLAAVAEARAGAEWTIDLPAQTILAPGLSPIVFSIEPERKERLVKGLDEVSLTLLHQVEIAAFAARQRQSEPWLWDHA
jgi:3-isopropylmalate/(R)-2-methylmalate dehydratase small subunit